MAQRISRRQLETAAEIHDAAYHVLRTTERDSIGGIASSRLSVLAVLVFGGPMTIGQLAAAERVKSPTMTGVVNGLEQDGLVRRGHGGDDARRVLVEVTIQGRRALQRERDRRSRTIATRLAGLSADDLATVGRAARLLDELFGSSWLVSIRG